MPSAPAVLRSRPTSEPSARTIPCCQPAQPKVGAQGVQEGLTQVKKQAGKLHATGRWSETLCGQSGETAGVIDFPSISCPTCRALLLAEVRRDHDDAIAAECARLWGWTPPVRVLQHEAESRIEVVQPAAS